MGRGGVIPDLFGVRYVSAGPAPGPAEYSLSSRRTRMRTFSLACLLGATGCAAPAWAQPPLKAAHRDPDAPCYRWPAVDMDGDGVFDRIDRCINTPKGCTVDKWGCETDGDHDGVCDGLDKCPDTPAGMRVDASGCS